MNDPNAYFRQRYASNREHILAGQRRRMRDRQQYIESLKSSGCVDCGERDPIVLDFDHVRGEKSRDVSAMVNASVTRIDAEVAKCEVRCANCHRRVTHRRRKAS